MKSKITLLLFTLCSILGFAQDKTYDLLKDKTQTKILYDRVYNLSDATKIKTEGITTNYFLQVYHEMQRADFMSRMPKLENIRKEADLGFAQKQIPLSILITDFETIKKSVIENKDVFLNTNNLMDVKPNATEVFETHSINLIAPILSKSKTNQVTFILKNNLIFNTTNRKITSIAIQTEDTKSWKTIVIDQPFQINFSKAGTQTIQCKIQFESGETMLSSFELNTDNQSMGLNNKSTTNALTPNVVNTITSTVAYQGYGETAGFVGQGEYEIFLDTTNGILDKPIFLLDGFDPGDSRNVSAIYSLLNYGSSGQNLADDLRALGYDVIILNFPTYSRPDNTVIDGGVDYIQRNAMILVELLNQINAQKVGTEQNVIIGPSMGGLISRYALRYMETHTMDPDTRLYVSFDSPHLGANVPIGYQHLFNYMAFGPLADVTMQTLVNSMLKSPAAREMLIDHFEGHLQSGSPTEFNTAAATLLPTGCPNYRTAFQNELNTLGFPQSTRNIAIANGAGNGTMTGTPNMVAMNHTFNVTSTQRAIIDLRFTPYANLTNQVSRFRGQQWIIVWITGYESLANSKSPTYTDGLDSAPGGRFDMNSIAAAGTGNAIFTEFMNNLNIMYFDFIPTLSSMAISSSTNLYSNVNSSSTTPFAAYYIPTTNENHVTLTTGNVPFVLNEILNPALSTNDNVALNSIWIANPVQNTILINSNYTLENTSVSITDILGKTIFTANNQTINGTLEIPVSLSNGVYLITITDEKGSITKKIVKG